MSLIKICIFIVCVVLSHTSLPAAYEHVLRGRVTSKLGDPLPNAEIQVFEISGRHWDVQLEPITSGTTNDQGEYLIRGELWGPLLVLVKAQGFVRAGFWNLKHADEILDVVLELGQVVPMERTVRGKVHLADGQGVEDCTVSLIAVLNSSWFYQTRSDRRGHFEFHIGPGGEFLLAASCPGRPTTVTTVGLWQDGDEKKVDLEVATKPKP